MARPKGSKNKRNTDMEKIIVKEDPRVFNYEEDDGNFDSSYNALQQTLSVPETPAVALQIPLQQNKELFFEVQNTQIKKLFLVEGDVQLSSRIPGQGVARSKQTRIVYAESDEEALAKFIGYFNSLNNEQSVYTVTGAGISEAIY